MDFLAKQSSHRGTIYFVAIPCAFVLHNQNFFQDFVRGANVLKSYVRGGKGLT